MLTDDDIITEIGLSHFLGNKIPKDNIIISNNNKKMNTTDVVFYLTMIGMVWSKTNGQLQALIPSTLFGWLNWIFAVVAIVAFAFYEKINGTTPTPTV